MEMPVLNVLVATDEAYNELAFIFNYFFTIPLVFTFVFLVPYWIFQTIKRT